jgi:uncharacterized membrane protein HdeD (DUF308 family)
MTSYKIAIILGILLIILGLVLMTLMAESMRSMGLVFTAVGGVTMVIALNQRNQST